MPVLCLTASVTEENPQHHRIPLHHYCTESPRNKRLWWWTPLLYYYPKKQGDVSENALAPSTAVLVYIFRQIAVNFYRQGFCSIYQIGMAQLPYPFFIPLNISWIADRSSGVNSGCHTSNKRMTRSSVSPFCAASSSSRYQTSCTKESSKTKHFPGKN